MAGKVGQRELLDQLLLLLRLLHLLSPSLLVRLRTGGTLRAVSLSSWLLLT